MPDLPVMLKLAGRRVLIVGGGPTALRRARAMLACGARVAVVAPRVHDDLAALAADAAQLTLESRAYGSADCAGAALVVIATDDGSLNDRIAADARAAGALVNRADDPEAGDAVVAAHRRLGPITVAVSTDGASAAAAATLVERCAQAIDADWPTLLQTIAPFRDQLQQTIADADARQAALRRLVDADAMAALKAGGIDALQRHGEAVVRDAR